MTSEGRSPGLRIFAQVSKLQGDLSREREVRESEAEAAARKIREKERRVVALEADLDAEYRLGVSRDQTIKELREKVRRGGRGDCLERRAGGTRHTRVPWLIPQPRWYTHDADPADLFNLMVY